MLNPGLVEMMATDRITELRAAGAKRSLRADRSGHAGTGARPASARSIWHVGQVDDLAVPPDAFWERFRVTNPQRAIGWFLVSVGLRLVVPRSRTGSAR